jgi:Cft2 family RNA processing exonuclease
MKDLRERNSVALVGFQAAGTRGRQLIDGATSVKIHGEYLDWNAGVPHLGDGGYPFARCARCGARCS